MSGRLSTQRCAVYARFSTDKQRQSSIGDQVRRCRDYIEREGGQLNEALVFQDEALSGSSMIRPGLQRLMAASTGTPRLVDTIVVEDLSRLTRDFADAATVFKDLQYHQVTLIGVADGIDTSQRGATLSSGIKSLISDFYLEELADKTRRGLEGRALAGHATGALAYGYKSRAELGPDGAVAGHAIEIDEEQAKVIRFIFSESSNGRSTAQIARLLNDRGVAPPRPRHGRKPSWASTAIRSMLLNERYAGRWAFGERQWVRVPGTNKRRPRPRPPEDVMRMEREDLRIVDEATWQVVHKRFQERRRTGTRPGRPSYLFSGLLRCGCCGSNMTIHGGDKSRRYYRCDASAKRGDCSNRLSVLEHVVRTQMFAGLRHRLGRPEAVEHVREGLAARLRARSKDVQGDLDDVRERLARTEERISSLVEFIADGDRSEYVVSALGDLEAEAKADKAAIASLEQQLGVPAQMPLLHGLNARVLELDDRLSADVPACRADLKRLFGGRQIFLHPGQDGVYTARAKARPLELLRENKTPPGGEPDGVSTIVVAGAGCEPTTFGL